MRRLLFVAAFVALMMMVAAPAFAGEWNKGRFNAPGGDLPAKYHANSECVFNGLDEPDATEGTIPFSDDFFWTQKPGQAVQTAGHAIRAGIAEPGDAGQACNGHLNPLK